MIAEGSQLWHYLSSEQQSLARDGYLLIEDRKLHPAERLGDYSYLVFPFAKLYEGFLKQLFRDLHIISDADYRGDRFRIGKSLSPHLVRRLRGRSGYGQIEERFGKDLATRLWHTWKEGRNLVFHYFPRNFRALTLQEAEDIIIRIIETMDEAIQKTGVLQSKN